MWNGLRLVLWTWLEFLLGLLNIRAGKRTCKRRFSIFFLTGMIPRFRQCIHNIPAIPAFVMGFPILKEFDEVSIIHR